MQNFIRIRVANPTNQARIGKRSRECTVFERKRVAKRPEIAREDVDSSRVDGTQALLAREYKQRCAVLRAGFCGHATAVGKIQGCQTVAARQRCRCMPPAPPG